MQTNETQLSNQNELDVYDIHGKKYVYINGRRITLEEFDLAKGGGPWYEQYNRKLCIKNGR